MLRSASRCASSSLEGVTHSFEPAPETPFEHPSWSVNATIYQINTRHFTPEGTLRAAMAHLPRLAELGVGIRG